MPLSIFLPTVSMNAANDICSYHIEDHTGHMLLVCSITRVPHEAFQQTLQRPIPNDDSVCMRQCDYD